MKKLKLYLDTSVISHLDAPDAPDKMVDTLKLWEALKRNSYIVCISPLVITEIEDCYEPKQSKLLKDLTDIKDFTIMLKETEEVADLANKYINAGILTQRNFSDCGHIAYASVYNCDMIISWNFKHMVNFKTIAGVKSVNALASYREMPIYTPTMFISGLEDEYEAKNQP
jgi:predicted nucleic acid-binding protein